MATSRFDHFYSSWFDHLHHLLRPLSAHSSPTATAATPSQEPSTVDHHSHLVNKFMGHYSEYYRVKGVAVERDVLLVVAAPWATALERSLHWIAGWRPTTIYHLIYTESSIVFESHIVDILRGVRTCNLGDLSPSQFRRVSELQCDTVREENAIAEELSQWQDDVGELVVAASDMDGKVGQLARVVKKADELRMKTLKSVVELLTPQQGAEFLVAASELLFGIRAWGLSHECTRQQ